MTGDVAREDVGAGLELAADAEGKAAVAAEGHSVLGEAMEVFGHGALGQAATASESGIAAEGGGDGDEKTQGAAAFGAVDECSRCGCGGGSGVVVQPANDQGVAVGADIGAECGHGVAGGDDIVGGGDGGDAAGAVAEGCGDDGAVRGAFTGRYGDFAAKAAGGDNDVWGGAHGKMASETML